MKKYKVHGTFTITITKEVWANDEDEAVDKAYEKFGGVHEYCGNGGYDKLVGVDDDTESVAADGEAEWGNYIEELEDNPDYHECPECGEELDEEQVGVWCCSECDMYFDSDGNEIDEPFEEDEDEE